MSKYFIKFVWNSSGESSFLLEEQHKDKAESRAETIKKNIINKLKELGSEGSYSDVNYRIEKVDAEL